MKKILLLNAPPYAGKDTVAEHLVENHGFVHHKFAKTLKERTHKLYGIDAPWDAYEGKVKDISNPDFLGLSPRKAYIEVSERYMKPLHGKSVWAQLFVKDLEENDTDYVVVSDLGFQIEWEYLISHFGFEKIALGMMYRGGCNFDNDSRDYVAPRGPWKYIKMNPKDMQAFNSYIAHNCFDIDNSGNLEDLYNKVDAIADHIKSGVVDTSNVRNIGSVPNTVIGT